MRTHETTKRILVPTTSVIEGDRIRADYGNLQDLADSIKNEGLIHPIVIDLNYRLIAGGRRFRAMRDLLKFTEVEVNFMECLDEATLRRLEAEENVRRKDMTWQEKVRSVKTVHLHQELAGALKGSRWTQKMTGEIIGYSQAHVSYALQIATLIEKGDEGINKCDGFSSAIKLLTERLEAAVTADIAKATVGNVSNTTTTAPRVQDILADGTEFDIFTPAGPVVGLASRPSEVELPGSMAPAPRTVIPLSSMLFQGDSLAWMTTQPEASFDHIICDPPYGIEMKNIQQTNYGMNIDSTRDEHDVDANVELLNKFIPLAYRLLRDKSYFIMWCDLDHWNMLQSLCVTVGFRPQRWPLYWRKTSICQNNAAQTNFTKTVETCLIARKGNATLVSPQTRCDWEGSGTGEKDLFGHPFAKPTQLWKWLYGAVAIRGQRVLDPFAGSGSSTVAAISVGLQPVAVELKQEHYEKLVLNVSNTYKSMIPNVEFQ